MTSNSNSSKKVITPNTSLGRSAVSGRFVTKKGATSAAVTVSRSGRSKEILERIGKTRKAALIRLADS